MRPCSNALLLRTCLSVTAFLFLPVIATAWTSAALIDAHTTTALRFETNLTISAGSTGNWGAIWASDGETTDTENGIFFRRSIDNGVSWQPLQELSGIQTLPRGSWGEQPCLDTDGALTWIAAWDACQVSGNQIDSSRDLFFTRSTNGGASWTAPALLNANASDLRIRNYGVSLENDGSGRWYAAWEIGTNHITDWYSTTPVCLAGSTDNGATWSSVRTLDPGTSTSSNQHVSIATDKQGTWIVAWDSTGTTDSDIRFCRSTDHGATWPTAGWLNSNAQVDDTKVEHDDTHPKLATNGGQVWMAVWRSNYEISTGFRCPDRIVYSRSSDDGLTWSPAEQIVPGSPFVGIRRHLADVTWNGEEFIAIWSGTLGLEWSSCNASGGPWTAPAMVTGTLQADSQSFPSLDTSTAGSIIAGWVHHAPGSTGPHIVAARESSASAVEDWSLWQ